MFTINGGNNRTALLSFAAHTAAIMLLLVTVLGATPASAGGKNTSKPPTPANFHVAAKTAYTVTLAWDPVPANSGDFNYHL
jgi:hypothetical protein